MKNSEKYKTPEERLVAFKQHIRDYANQPTPSRGFFAAAEACLDWLEQDDGLKPCPFCGSGSFISEAEYHSFIIECHKCGAKTIRCKDIKSAIRCWNKRI